MKAKRTACVVFIYSICILAGGVIGFSFSGSKPSLISGLVFGPLLFIASILMLKKKKIGSYSALFLAIMLDGVFTWRFVKTLNFFPSGLFSLLSLTVIILVALKIGERFKVSR